MLPVIPASFAPLGKKKEKKKAQAMKAIRLKLIALSVIPGSSLVRASDKSKELPLIRRWANR